MAERRMFSKSIIDSDAFLDMPTSSRLLYFDLSMRADDDGFVDSPKKIIRMTGASEDDLKLLILKQFLLPFDSGVVVIKHWRIHNYIQKDRYKETLYLEEKAQLNIKDNKEYIINSNPIETDTPCIQNVDEVDTQVRLGKVRLELGKDTINYTEIVNKYNETCVSLPKVRVPISGKRQKAIKARLTKYTEEDLYKAFELAEASDFMKGDNNRNWQADFDWIIKDTNLPKILEGKYNNKQGGNYKQKEEEYIPQYTEDDFTKYF